MMDPCGAIVGPAAVALLGTVGHHYPTLFAWTLVPGLLAVGAMGLAVVEKERQPVKLLSFGASLRALPSPFRRFLLAVGVFAAVMAMGIMVLPVSLVTLALIFALGGVYVAVEETWKTRCAPDWRPKRSTGWRLAAWRR